jgi:hypothetical protein
VLWLLLLLRRQYTARTGVWPFDCAFGCAHCGAQCQSRVFAEGFGAWTSTNGDNPNGPAYAHQIAMQNYQAAVRGAFANAACPACGKFAPVVTSQADHEGTVRAEAERSRYTWAAVAGAVVLLAALGGAFYDRSGFLASAGLCGGVAAALVALYLRTPTIANVRLVHPRNVAFWWNGDWFAPNASYTPAEDATHARGKLFGWMVTLGALVLGTSAAGCLVMWGASFHDLYVVNTEPSGSLHVSVDGQPVGEVGPTANGDMARMPSGQERQDAASQRFTVRPGSHVVEVFGDDGKSLERRDLDVDRFDDAWFFTPRAPYNRACFSSVVTTYAKDGDAPGPVVTRYDQALFSVSFNDLLVASPTSVTLDNNATETKRTAVRALICGKTTIDGDGTPLRARGPGSVTPTK